MYQYPSPLKNQTLTTPEQFKMLNQGGMFTAGQLTGANNAPRPQLSMQGGAVAPAQQPQPSLPPWLQYLKHFGPLGRPRRRGFKPLNVPFGAPMPQVAQPQFNQPGLPPMFGPQQFQQFQQNVPY